MKRYVLLILFASVVVVNSQNLYPREYPMHVLCKAMGNEKYPAGMPILNTDVVAIEVPTYAQRATDNRIERVWVQVVVNQNGEVVTATPIVGFEHLWAASVKAAVTARFDPQKLPTESSKVAGILLFKLSGGKVDLDKMSDGKSITVPPVRREIPKP
jgi:hypothetical protein